MLCVSSVLSHFFLCLWLHFLFFLMLFCEVRGPLPQLHRASNTTFFLFDFFFFESPPPQNIFGVFQEEGRTTPGLNSCDLGEPPTFSKINFRKNEENENQAPAERGKNRRGGRKILYVYFGVVNFKR